MPLYPTGPSAPTIGGANTVAGPNLSTTNRTLLHHQQQNQFGSNGNVLATGTIGRNGTALRGLAYNGDSPPPEYNVVVHDKRHGFYPFITTSVHHYPTYRHLRIHRAPTNLISQALLSR